MLGVPATQGDAMTTRVTRLNYIKTISRKPLPAGTVLVHNSVIPQKKFGANGFRWWTQTKDDRLEVCPCDWAGIDLHGLIHYRNKTKTHGMDELYHTAIHEAGHAVAAMELNIQFDMVSVLPHESFAGNIGVEGDDGYWLSRTDPNSPENKRAYREWARQQAVIDYAGHAAIVVLLDWADMGYRSAMQHGAGDDYDKASKRLGHDFRSIKKARGQATEIIAKRQADISKIAKALVEHGRLDAQQIDILLLTGKVRKYSRP
jgi:hypothetical protein